MKQIKTSYTWLMALAVLLLAAASCSDETAPGLSGESVPVEVSASLDGGINETRAVTTVTSGSIGVFVGNANGYTPQYNIQYTYSSGWQPASYPIYVGDANASLCAYYDPNNVVVFPANSTVTQSKLTAQTYDETKLWYYATTGGNSVCSATPQASFDMTLAYARLTFSLTRNAYYPAACKITRIAITSGGGTIYSTASVNIADGTLTGTKAANYTIDTSAQPMGTTGIAQGATDTSVDWLFPPQMCNGLKVTLTVDGKDLSVTIPNAKFSGFTGGTRYTVQVEIAGTTITAVTIPDSWTANNITDGSDPYVPAP